MRFGAGNQISVALEREVSFARESESPESATGGEGDLQANEGASGDVVIPSEEDKAGRLVDLQVHPIANMFPLMSGQANEDLKSDIAKRGILESILLHRNGTILDGRNRYRAYREIGNPDIHLPLRTYLGDDADLPAFLVSLNINRRHLTKGQRLEAAVKLKWVLGTSAETRRLANLKQNQNTEVKNFTPREEGKARDQAAEAFGFSGPMVDRAEKITRDGSSALIKAWIDGKLTTLAAYDLLGLPADEQERVVSLEKKDIAKTLKGLRKNQSTVSSEQLDEAITAAIENVVPRVSEAQAAEGEDEEEEAMTAQVLHFLELMAEKGYRKGVLKIRDAATDKAEKM